MEQLIYRFISSNDELEEAFNIRRRVFVEEQNISEDIELDEYDSVATHIIVKDGDRAIGTARVQFPAKGIAKIERMAVLKDFRRRGIGSNIIKFLTEDFKKRKIEQVVLHAQYAVVDFYRSCGFKETGEPFIEAGIKHIRMEKKF